MFNRKKYINKIKELEYILKFDNGFVKYKNLSGNSGVDSYIIYDGGIIVKFLDGSDYQYSVDDNGIIVINSMIDRANSGRFLQTYINENKPIYG